ncbi:ribonuclease H2, subunit B [Thamnidium elegans]|nr:ribonuclease H2, subunit B [Thamnidium elegans]
MKIVAFTSKEDQELNDLTELYLPCPRSSRRSVYFHDKQGKLYELKKVTGPGRKSAWLIDNTIHKDGAVRFITPIDPLFMALPIIEQASKEGKFRSLDDIFSRENVNIEVVANDFMDEEALAEEYSKPIDVHRLTNITGFKEQLGHLCDMKEITSNLFVYKLNEENALNWLVMKVDAIMSNENFKKLFEQVTKEQDLMKIEAVYTLSNYINQGWFNKLLTKLDLDEKKEELGDITNYVTDVSPSAYFKRVHPEERMLDAPAKKKKLEVPRSLSKVNTRGMKPLTSFFTKK